jgi:hypothetical protein
MIFSVRPATRDGGGVGITQPRDFGFFVAAERAGGDGRRGRCFCACIDKRPGFRLIAIPNTDLMSNGHQLMRDR